MFLKEKRNLFYKLKLVIYKIKLVFEEVTCEDFSKLI